MTLIYNDIPYEVTAESIYCDFGIRVSTIDEACTIINDLADMETNVIFGGRLAEYKYYDMAPIIEKVLQIDIK